LWQPDGLETDRFRAHIREMAQKYLSGLDLRGRPLTLLVSGIMVVLLLYGCVRFYDGPISECASGYCSTHGQIHTAAEYRAFKVWATAIWIVWPLGMAALFFLQRKKDSK
jgi:hypothetical protein